MNRLRRLDCVSLVIAGIPREGRICLMPCLGSGLKDRCVRLMGGFSGSRELSRPLGQLWLPAAVK